MEAIVWSAKTFTVSGHLISKRQVWTIRGEGHLGVLLLRMDEGGGGGGGEEAGGRTGRHGGGRAPLGRKRPYSFNGFTLPSLTNLQKCFSQAHINIYL